MCRIRSQEARAKQVEAVKHKLYSPRSATPCVPDKSPVKQDIVNENYLKKNELALSVAGDKQPALGAFEMAYTRKGQESKIKKLLEKQKKKAERMNNKKYQGFGDTKAAAAAATEEDPTVPVEEAVLPWKLEWRRLTTNISYCEEN